MKKGGYKIINFKGTALSGTAVELSGIYDQIVDDYDKPIMVSGVTISGKLQDDAYADVQEKTAQDLSKSVELTVYGGIITVTEDDEVTFASAKSNTELTANVNTLFNDPNITTLTLSGDNLKNNLTSLTLGKCALAVASAGLNNMAFGTNRSGIWIVRKTSANEVDIVSYTAADLNIFKGRYVLSTETFSSKSVFQGTELT